MKTIDAYFRDWEGTAFGYGYGTGEEHIVPALKQLFAAIPERSYDYEVLEAAVGPTVAWLLINVLCKRDIFEYGTSPRYGWLTDKGQRLKAYLDGHTIDELHEALQIDQEETPPCYPDACNCGPKGYDPKAKCANPFWCDPA